MLTLTMAQLAALKRMGVPNTLKRRCIIATTMLLGVAGEVPVPILCKMQALQRVTADNSEA